MEKKTIEVIVGKEPTGAVDASKVVKGLAVAPKDQSEVGGRELYETRVECPSCGAINLVVASTNVYRHYECWNCGYVFTY